MRKEEEFILLFEDIRAEDTALVGGKTANLGEMYNELRKKGINVPGGFAITAAAYRYFLEKAGIKEKIRKTLRGLNAKNIKQLMEKGQKVRHIIMRASLPEELEIAITQAYQKLCRRYKEQVDVAVRSSATAEDLPSISNNEHVLVRVNNKPIYDTVEKVYALVGENIDVDIEIPSLCKNEIKWRKVKRLYRHKANHNKMYKIKTATGREILVSPNHSLIVLDEDTLKPKTVSSIYELDGKERVPVINSLPEINKTGKEVNVLDYIKGDNIKEDRGLLKIKESQNWKVQNGLVKSIPINKDLAYFLGVYLAEGSTYKDNGVTVTNKDKKIISRIIRFFDSLNLYKPQKLNRGTFRIYNKTLVRFLHSVCGAPPKGFKGKGKLCYTKRVPNFVFGWNEQLIGEFLKGCFDGDGYVSKGGIGYCSSSEMLVGGIIKLLETLNIEFLIRKKGNVKNINIPEVEATKFKEKIGFESNKKLKKLESVIETGGKKRNHPQFINALKIANGLSQEIKDVFEENIPKKQVIVANCPICKKIINKGSKYKTRERYYCNDCHKAFYECDIKKEKVKKYVYYDKQGRFTKGQIPWNKGQLSGSFGIKRFREKLRRYGIENRFTDFFSNSLKWDQIKEINAVDYNGWVYDFEVPGTENFAAGLGGIITHNSASFAGQQETYLNIKGKAALLEACKKCFASLFTNRAIVYRHEKGFGHEKIYLSIAVQKMVRSDKSCSGVIFTLDTESGFRDVVLISAGYGLGETIVQGKITPDRYFVFKPTLKKGFNPIISKKLGTKKIKLVYSEEGSKTTKEVPVPYEERKKYCLTEHEVITLAKWACTIENHYSKKAKHEKPMDLEWAKDGVTNALFILQARPETVHAAKDKTMMERYELKQKSKVITSGLSIGEKIGQGRAHVIKDTHNISDFKPGEVLVTDMTDPDWVPVMKIAKAIVTNRGGKVCHAAIVSRELGVPCIVGTGNATDKIRSGQAITVSCAEGEEGYVYEGLLEYKTEKIDLKELPKTKTKIMMNIGQPDFAFSQSFIPNQGVGLAREEFIINSYIKIHPLALINYKRIHNSEIKKEINEITLGYKNKKQYFVDKLAEGIAMIAAAFYPKEVIVRFSDFKSNEYANLIGGHMFEPHEENPMLGFRGASRYYSKEFKEAFVLECKAMKKVREEMGLSNIKVMVPFCRTVDEGKKVLKIMEKNGLKKGKNGLEVYVMCEIPSNVILAEEFAEIFDGFSIGSNDLTQLTLGLDRDSELISRIFDERNEAVKKLIKEVIGVAHKKGKKVGICGDAPSTLPDFAGFLVECGIDSISLTPDAIIKTTLAIAEKEKKLLNRK